MARTFRTPHPRTARWSSWRSEREQHMFMKGAKHYRSNKCMDATVDSEGNHKLNTWSETLQKTDNEANRKIRRQGKVQIARQLEDA